MAADQVRALALPPEATLTDGANIAWDLLEKPNAVVTLGGNRAVSNPTNTAEGYYILTVVQDGTGSRSITSWGSAFSFTGLPASQLSSNIPVLSSTAGAIDVLGFKYKGNKMLCLGMARDV